MTGHLIKEVIQELLSLRRRKNQVKQELLKLFS
jgi:hypothetical protein